MPTESTGNTIEATRTRFESAWKSGGRPKLEDFLADWQEPDCSKLLSELMSLELAYVSQQGQPVVRGAYEKRFPQHIEVVVDAFERWADQSMAETRVFSGSGDSLLMQSKFDRLRLHAQGGLGQIFRAGDQGLGRDVAVKFIRSNLSDDSESRNRFRLEAEITSCLEHPGVVPVYGFGGAEEGRLFYAMRFIEGETLDDSIGRFHDSNAPAKLADSRRDMQFRELLGRFVAMCKTIAYAHNRGIVHRDIKPDNVMLGRYGETIVIDWGLAIPVNREGVFKQSTEKTLTPGSGSDSSAVEGVVAGTPAYMSPEQASGNAISPASDIYSLGSTLYKVLTGKAPFVGSVEAILGDLRHGRLTPPSKINNQTPKPLEAICLKAMSLYARDRYATALELAEDLERYLADAPVTAFAEPASTRLARWGRRHRLLSLGILAGLLALAVAGVSAAFVFGRLRDNAVAATQDAVAAKKAEEQLLQQSLSVSARFAARTMANRIDIRLRMLEHAADDSILRNLIAAVNRDPQDPEARRPLQAWLDEVGQRYAHMESFCWFICAQDGSQVSRYPSRDANGEPYASLAKNYAYRDYFHGQGRDFDDQIVGAPLQEANVSVAMASTNDGSLLVVFSAPIQAGAGLPALGVIGMPVELGKFADLRMPLPTGQKVLLVDTRTYYMKHGDSEVRGEGLILHHDDLVDFVQHNRTLPHLDDAIVRRLREAKQMWNSEAAEKQVGNLLADNYRDPVALPHAEERWLAAFAPVILSARADSAKVHDTRCFVIVQQQH